MAEIFHETVKIVSGKSRSQRQSNKQFNQLHGELGVYNPLGNNVSEDITFRSEVISLSEAFRLQISNELCRLDGMQR